MPFIDGETVREKLNRETQLGIDEAVRITTDIADARRAVRVLIPPGRNAQLSPSVIFARGRGICLQVGAMHQRHPALLWEGRLKFLL